MVFSRAMLLLSICSKQPISYKELDNYYDQFERNYFGHSVLYGYFLHSNFFDIVLDNWLQNLPNNFATQKVIECLAINRSITLDELIKKTGLKEDEIIAVLKSHTVQIHFDLPAINSKSQVSSDININKQYFINFISRALISETGNTYQLSLFGVMLMISLIRYHYVGIDSNRLHNLDTTNTRIDLFYKDMRLNEYCDIIARNYKDKLPLIFGKWNILLDQLGSLLYNSFDSLFYKKTGSKSTADSVWIGGNKEFYDDIQALASNARYHLSPLYSICKSTMDGFQRYLDSGIWTVHTDLDSRISPLRHKLYEMKVIFDADIPLTESPGTNHLSFENESESQRLHRVEIIEGIFKEELTFLFYLNLNTTVLSSRMENPTKSSPLEITQDEIEQKRKIDKEMSDLGNPKNRLMAILTKDNDIKQWFNERMSEIMHYRKQTLNKMSEFYDEILDSSKYVKKERNGQEMAEGNRIEIYPEEFNVNKICSYDRESGI
jgi:hypothetical protein